MQRFSMSSKKYDIIIAGAGASGLSLLWYLLHSEALSSKKILIVDKSLSPDNTKTWCFWDKNDFQLQNLIHHSWNKLDVIANKNTYSGLLSDYNYHCIKSLDFTSSILQIASTKKNVDLVEDDILSISSDNNQGILQCDNQNYTAPLIFQSIFHPPSYSQKKTSIRLKQHFLGWEIETKSSFFDPQRATLMDFDVPQQNGISFMYVLPYSKQKALIEYTIFSEQILDKHLYTNEIKAYLENRLNIPYKLYNIQREEVGIIPMEDGVYTPWYNPNTYSIGAVGGQTKPTTGYTFMRIQKKCRQIITALENNQTLPDNWVSPYRYRVYDIMMLYLLRFEPKNSIQIFEDLFKNNRFDQVLGFLDEQTTFTEELSIFWSLPSTPFLRSIYKMKHRIFTGA